MGPWSYQGLQWDTRCGCCLGHGWWDGGTSMCPAAVGWSPEPLLVPRRVESSWCSWAWSEHGRGGYPIAEMESNGVFSGLVRASQGLQAAALSLATQALLQLPVALGPHSHPQPHRAKMRKGRLQRFANRPQPAASFPAAPSAPHVPHVCPTCAGHKGGGWDMSLESLTLWAPRSSPEPNLLVFRAALTMQSSLLEKVTKARLSPACPDSFLLSTSPEVVRRPAVDPEQAGHAGRVLLRAGEPAPQDLPLPARRQLLQGAARRHEPRHRQPVSTAAAGHFLHLQPRVLAPGSAEVVQHQLVTR